MFRSIFLNFTSKFIERRTSMLPLLVAFPTAGLIIATTSTIIELSIVHYQNKKKLDHLKPFQIEFHNLEKIQVDTLGMN